MKILHCYDDQSKWGVMLHMAALRRKIPTTLWRKESPKDGVVFYKMRHHPDSREKDKEMIAEIAGRGIPTIPGALMAHLYDDKVAQYANLKKWMPKSFYAATIHEACKLIPLVNFPVISKAACGASSHNVRMLMSYADATKEVGEAFSEGIPLWYDQRQQNYVFWQERLAPESPEYRVICIGKQRYISKRINKEGTQFASGSGISEPVLNHDSDEIKSVLEFVNRFIEYEDFTFIALDIKQKKSGWLLLEISCSWVLESLFESPFLPDGRTGEFFFDIILDEYEKGNL